MAKSFDSITAGDVERKSFADELQRLNRGVIVAWIINFLIMFATIWALIALVTMFGVQSMDDLRIRLLFTGLIAAGITLIIMMVIYLKPNKLMMGAIGGTLVKVDSGRVYNTVEEMCIASGVQGEDIPNVYIARYTGMMNAYVIDDGAETNVIVTKKLADSLTRAELQAVVAHEMGHVNSEDSLAMTRLMAMSSVVLIISSFITDGFLDMLEFGFDDHGPRDHHRDEPPRRDDRRDGGSSSRSSSSSSSDSSADGVAMLIALAIMVACIVFLICAPMISRAARNHMSRTRESRADAYAVQYTRNPTALATALVRLDALQGDKDSYDRDAKKFYKRAGDLAFYSPDLNKRDKTHPSMNDRVSALISMGADVSRVNAVKANPTLGVENPEENVTTANSNVERVRSEAAVQAKWDEEDRLERERERRERERARMRRAPEPPAPAHVHREPQRRAQPVHLPDHHNPAREPMREPARDASAARKRPQRRAR